MSGFPIQNRTLAEVDAAAAAPTKPERPAGFTPHQARNRHCLSCQRPFQGTGELCRRCA